MWAMLYELSRECGYSGVRRRLRRRRQTCKTHLTLRLTWHMPRRSRPALSCVATPIFFQLNLKPANHISLTRPLFQLFPGCPLHLRPCGVHCRVFVALWFEILLRCIECMRCRLLLPMFAVSVRPSVCLSRGSTVCGAFVQPLPNYFGLLLPWRYAICLPLRLA